MDQKAYRDAVLRERFDERKIGGAELADVRSKMEDAGTLSMVRLNGIAGPELATRATVYCGKHSTTADKCRGGLPGSVPPPVIFA